MLKQVINNKKVRDIMIVVLNFLIIPTIYLLFHIYSCNMKTLPIGQLVSIHESPSGNYILKVYKCDLGATVDWFTRIELYNKNDNTKKNIYYNSHEEDVNVTWLDDYNVKITGIKTNESYEKKLLN